MGNPVNDGFINTQDYSVNFNLNTKVATFTDTSTYANVTGVTIAVTLTSPNGASLSAVLPVNGSVMINIPTINGGVVYGYYTLTAVATDSVSAYTLTKSPLNICRPLQCAGTRNSDGCLVTSVTFFCFDNKVLYQDQTSYVYEDIAATTVTKDVTVIDPNNVLKVDGANVSSFTISPIVNGRYSFTVINSAVYSFGESITVTIVYQSSNKQYNAQCDINLCDVRCATDKVYSDWKAAKGSGSRDERTLYEKWVRLAFLITSVENGIRCGGNVTDQVEEIEELSGASCACGCGTTNPNSINCSCNEIVFQEGAGITIDQTTAAGTTTVTIAAIVNQIAIAAGISSTMLSVASVTLDGVTTTTITDNGKIAADSTDVTAGYLFDKVESSDSSITISDDTTGTHQVDFKVTALVWTTLAPAGTFTAANAFQYAKDGYGNVYVRGAISGDPAQGNNTIGTLPVNFRPTVNTPFPTVWLQTSDSTVYAELMTINTTGVMVLYMSTNLGSGTTPVNFMFNVNL